MKIIKFTPLRRVKKSGKITVASYMQWRKVKTADYNEFKLLVGDEHKSMDIDEYVCNHKGEQLFWFMHKYPYLLPKNIVVAADVVRVLGIDESFLDGEEWKISEPIGKGFHWSVKGFDCDGVPVFSHNTQNYVATHYNDMNEFEPLTVGMVTRWFGWFLLELDNSKLI